MRPILTPRRIAGALLLPALLTLLSCPAGKTGVNIDAATADSQQPGTDVRMGEVDLGVPPGGSKDVSGKDGADTDAADVVKDLVAADEPAPDTQEVEVQADPCAGVDCDDDDQCTHDECLAGECVHAPHEGACEDGNACTVGDACVGGQCVAGEKLSCDDGNPCTDDACSSVQGCLHVPSEKSCNDGDPCTDGDVCKDGECLPGTTVVCHPCQTDADCLEYEDGNLCNGVASCVESMCQVLPESVVECPDDPGDCFVPVCAPQTGQCVPDPAEEVFLCNDGDACTLDDQCVDAVCTGKPINCTDGDACTTDSCNPNVGCMHEPVCDPPKVCTDAGKCCTPMVCGMIGMECGPRPDTCGNTVDCGDCPEGEECKDGVCSDGVCEIEWVSTVGGSAVGITVRDDFAYMAMGSAGLYVVDVSAPSLPKVVGKLTDVPADQVLVADGPAVVRPSDWGTFRFVDVEDPAAPVAVGDYTVDCEHGKWGVLDGELLVVACKDGSVEIVTYAAPSAPEVVGTYEVPGIVRSAYGSSNHLLLAWTESYSADIPFFIQLVDLSNPAAPGQVASWQVFPLPDEEGFPALRLVDEWVYLLNGRTGERSVLRVYQLDNGDEPFLASELLFDEQLSAMDFTGDIAWLAGAHTVTALDVGDPANPSELDTHLPFGHPKGLKGHDERAFVAGGSAGLQVLELDASNKIQLVGQTQNLPGHVVDLAVKWGYLFASSAYGGVKVYDIREPASPDIAAVVPTGDWAGGIDLHGSTIYAGILSGKLSVIDVSVPPEPVPLGVIDLELDGGVSDVAVADGAAYVALTEWSPTSSNWLATVDLESGDVNVASMPFFVGGDLELAGDFLLVAAGTLLVYDRIDPLSPSLCGEFDPDLCGAVGGYFVVSKAATDVGLRSG